MHEIFKFDILNQYNIKRCTIESFDCKSFILRITINKKIFCLLYMKEIFFPNTVQNIIIDWII